MDKKQKYISIISLILVAVLAIGAPIAGWLSRRQAPAAEMPPETVESIADTPPEIETMPDFSDPAAPQEPEPEQPPEETVVQRAVEKLEAQKKVDETLQAELESGSYTLESPLVVLDPYGESPLTALVLFETEEPSKIEITIPGEDEDTGAVHMFDEAAIQHVIPVYGLYPDQVNEVTLRQLSENGDAVSERVVEIRTEPLPEWLDDYIILTQAYGGDYESGLNYMYEPLKHAFDKNGTVRWYLSDVENQVLSAAFVRANDHWLVSYGAVLEGDAVIFEIDSLGKIYHIFYTPYGVHHDIESMPNGNLLVTSSHGQTTQDLLVEIDAETGEIIHTLDLKTVLQRSRFGAAQDWAHINSIVWDERDNTIIVSSNIQCTVMKLTWPEGEIKWLLSDPIEYMPRLRQYLLTPVGEDFEYSYNQHHATILPDYDNNPDTIDILLFDNGWTRFERDEELQRAIAAHEIVAPKNYSRLVHYRINEKDMTVQQIWQYGKERGAELFSYWQGSAQLLSNDNLLGCFNIQHNLPLLAASVNVVEVDHNGNLVWDAELITKGEQGNFTGYRAFRIPIYLPGGREHDIYTEGQNLIPQEVLDNNT